MFRSAVISLLLICLALIVACGTTSPNTPPATPPASFPDRHVEGYAVLGSCMMTLEIADTPEKRQAGLMSRQSLPMGHGMVFVYASEAKWPFWMKDTLIPLDIVWIDHTGRVTDVQTMKPHPGVPDDQLKIYTPRAPAMHAIEMAEGAAAKIGLAINSQVSLQLAPTPTPAQPLCGKGG